MKRLCLLLLLGAGALFAQDKEPHNAFYAQAEFIGGKLFPMYPKMPRTSFVQGAEFNFGWRVTGRREWHQLFNYPRLGLSVIALDLGNNRIYGQQFCLVPTAYFSTSKKFSRKFQTEIKTGLGLSFFNHPYDTIRNPDNYLVSTYVTWQFNVGVSFRAAITPHTYFQFGGSWMHSSNAHAQVPNVGVNNFVLQAGFVEFPFGGQSNLYDRESIVADKKIRYHFRFGAGWHERGTAFKRTNHKKYPVYTASFYISRKFWRVMKLNTGFTYRFYQNYFEYIKTTGHYSSHQRLKSSAFIWFFGPEFQLGRFALNLEGGLNLYKPFFKKYYDDVERGSRTEYWTKQLIATRFGFNFYLLDPYRHPRNNVFIGSYVSANMGQAEFLEMNIGYVF